MRLQPDATSDGMDIPVSRRHVNSNTTAGFDTPRYRGRQEQDLEWLSSSPARGCASLLPHLEPQKLPYNLSPLTLSQARCWQPTSFEYSRSSGVRRRISSSRFWNFISSMIVHNQTPHSGLVESASGRRHASNYPPAGVHSIGEAHPDS